jgi:hypothetical protein
MSYETLATIRLVRDEYGAYMIVIDYGNGSAPESCEGFNTLTRAFRWARRTVHETLKRRAGDDRS